MKTVLTIDRAEKLLFRRAVVPQPPLISDHGLPTPPEPSNPPYPQQPSDLINCLACRNISELHNMIRPFFLHRTKTQVLTFLLPIRR